MTDVDKKTIKRLWDSRVPINQIILMLPYKKVVAKRMIDELRANGTLKPRNCKKTAIQAIASTWDNGITDIDELCEMFSYKPNTVKCYLSFSRGNSVRPHRNYRAKQFNEKAQSIMDEISKQELSLSDIARKFEVSRQYVYQLKMRLEEKNNG